jgi:hypothetical protein
MQFFGESELVTLAAFASEQEFLVARGLLESEGIECFCPDLYSSLYAEAGVRGRTLQVRRDDLVDARAILDAPVEPCTEEGKA